MRIVVFLLLVIVFVGCEGNEAPATSSCYDLPTEAAAMHCLETERRAAIDQACEQNGADWARVPGGLFSHTKNCGMGPDARYKCPELCGAAHLQPIEYQPGASD